MYNFEFDFLLVTHYLCFLCGQFEFGLAVYLNLQVRKYSQLKFKLATIQCFQLLDVIIFTLHCQLSLRTCLQQPGRCVIAHHIPETCWLIRFKGYHEVFSTLNVQLINFRPKYFVWAILMLQSVCQQCVTSCSSVTFSVTIYLNLVSFVYLPVF